MRSRQCLKPIVNGHVSNSIQTDTEFYIGFEGSTLPLSLLSGQDGGKGQIDHTLVSYLTFTHKQKNKL